ncbi:Thylakoid lumenal 17.9 kDa protein, chloroplastic [Linum perenne]
MELIGRRIPLPPPSSSTSDTQLQTTSIPNFLTIRNLQSTFSNHLFSIAIALTLNTPPLPCYAIPSLASPSSPSPTTPFSQSKTLQFGLQSDGKIRPCPSTNPGCVSTNPKSSSFSFPWRIPHSDDDTVNEELATQKLEEAILSTQRNPEIRAVEITPFGRYVEAEVDGFYGTRDVMEFLVKRRFGEVQMCGEEGDICLSVHYRHWRLERAARAARSNR